MSRARLAWLVVALAIAATACSDAGTDGNGDGQQQQSRLELLEAACRADDYEACDELWRVTEVGSDLERLGASCNGALEVPAGASSFGDCAARFAGNGRTTTTDTMVTTTAAGVTTTTLHDVPVTLRGLALGEPPTSAWVVILRSVEEDRGRQVAEDFARQLDEVGVETGVFLSSDYGSLRPGFWVVYTGGTRDEDDAISLCGELRDLVPDCYHRLIER